VVPGPFTITVFILKRPPSLAVVRTLGWTDRGLVDAIITDTERVQAVGLGSQMLGSSSTMGLTGDAGQVPTCDGPKAGGAMDHEQFINLSVNAA
jgi:hypothetical protein